MLKLKVGGVPEHFNYPWTYALEHRHFDSRNLEIEFKFQEGGTGEMIDNLENKKLDLAIMLTEGAVYKINSGTNFKILQKYVETPLLWGIHVDANSKYKHISELENTTAAISRYGSGSHLMAVVNAQQQNWETSDLSFKVCDNLEKAVKSLSHHQSDYLLWERFTTKPLVDQGLLKRLGDCPTPWPCFVIVCRTEVYENHKEDILSLQNRLNQSLKTIQSMPALNKKIALAFNQKIEDVSEWLKITKWSNQQISKIELMDVQAQLNKLNLISSSKFYENFIFI